MTCGGTYCFLRRSPLYAKPAIVVAARRTGKYTSNLAKIGLLVCRPGSVEVAVRL